MEVTGVRYVFVCFSDFGISVDFGYALGSGSGSGQGLGSAS